MIGWNDEATTTILIRNDGTINDANGLLTNPKEF